ncbi:MAG: tetratricopeptide repeat protein [Planctomycetes bacterium]|nr:tetratricopeptide repeat protein [Planctomycetota bacterium]
MLDPAQQLRLRTSPDGRYLMITLADLRALIWDLEGDLTSPNAAPVAEYTDPVPSGKVCGFTADGRLAWVACNNEVHIFEALTARPFSILRLDAEVADACVSADGSVLVTLTVDGSAQRWPLDPIGVAKRRAQGQLEPRELAKYQIGTPDERLRRERELLLSRPTAQAWERLGQIDLEQGDLDGAIACYQAACDLGPHPPKCRGFYVRRIELLCRRLTAGGGDAKQQRADRDHAFEALAQALRCKVSHEELLALPGIDALRSDQRFAEMMAR